MRGRHCGHQAAGSAPLRPLPPALCSSSLGPVGTAGWGRRGRGRGHAGPRGSLGGRPRQGAGLRRGGSCAWGWVSEGTCTVTGVPASLRGWKCSETNKDSWAPTVPRRPRASARAPAPGSPFTPPPPRWISPHHHRRRRPGGGRVTTEPTGLSPSAQRPAVATSRAPVPGPRSVPSTQRAAAWGRVDCRLVWRPGPARCLTRL